MWSTITAWSQTHETRSDQQSHVKMVSNRGYRYSKKYFGTIIRFSSDGFKPVLQNTVILWTPNWTIGPVGHRAELSNTGPGSSSARFGFELWFTTKPWHHYSLLLNFKSNAETHKSLQHFVLHIVSFSSNIFMLSAICCYYGGTYTYLKLEFLTGLN